MRKIYLSIVAFVFASLMTIAVQAQLSLYSVSPLTGQTYTQISGGTLVNTNTGLTPGFASANQDDGGILVTLPFTFTYNGANYTQMSMCTNGWVAVGNMSVIDASSSRIPNNFFTVTIPNNTLAPWFRDMGANFPLGTGAMVHGLVGTDVYAFEWRNAVGTGFSDGATTVVNFMVKIYGPNSTAPGRIQFLYGSTTGTIATGTAIGIEDATGGTNHYINALTGTMTATTTSTAWPGNGNGYQFDPPPPCVVPAAQPTALVLTPGTGSMGGSFTAASPAPSGYLVVRTTTNVAPVPVNGTVYTPGNSAIGFIESAGTATTFTSTFLNSNTQYYYWVFSYNDLCFGAPFYLATAPLTASATTTNCSISGVKTVGPTGNYPTLTAAVNAVVAGGITGPVVLELEPAYTSASETYPINLGYVPCASSTNTITIRPATGATGLSISGTNSTAILDFNSGKYWKVDGRPGGVGTTSQLTIANNSTSGVTARFINDAQYDVLNYVDLQGQNTVSPGNGISTPAGVVFISNTSLPNATGNDFISITNCSIHGTIGFTPAYGIFAFGSTTTVASNNDSITISNNNIYDFFTPSGTSTGIKADAGNNAWTISGNSFYQTAARTTTATNIHRALWITPVLSAPNNPGGGFVINDNYIGGSAPLAGGGPLTLGGAFGNTFQGLDLFVGLGTPTLAQNNVIRNIAVSTTNGAGFLGISEGGGHVNMNGNTIGSSTTTGDITVTTTLTGGGTVVGYRVFGGTGAIVNITNNTFAGVTTAGTINYGVHIQGILVGGATTTNVTNNTVGSTTVANSVNASAATNGNGQAVHGILVNGGTFTNITGNTVANLNNNYISTVASAVTRGIAVAASISTISNNLIFGLSSTAQVNNAVTGIQMSSTSGAVTINGNTIHSLVCNNANLTIVNQVTGIFFSGSTTFTNTISNNFIHSLDQVTANPQGYITGIDYGAGTTNIFNNMIRLGLKADGSSVTNPVTIRGIHCNTASPLTNLYHNSVYIGGTGVATSTNFSFAFGRSSLGSYDLRDNIFSNARSNAAAGGGKHYSVYFVTSMSGMNVDYNVYDYPGTGGTFANNGVADVTTYASGWTSTDVHSYAANPGYANPTGNATAVDLHLTTGSIAEGTGTNIASVATDFDGQTRSGLTPTDIGADAGNYGATGADLGAILLVSPFGGGCSSSSQQVVVRIRNFSANSINLATNPVTVTVSATGPVTYNSNIVVNTGTLAAGATLDVTLPATINTSAPGTYVFNANTSVTGDANITNDAMGVTNVVIAAGTSLSGTYTVGATGNYTTLSAAVAAYNNASCISGNVVFSLTDPLYNAANGETFPIRIQQIVNPNNYTLTIKPATGVTATIVSGAADSAVIKLNGADNIIIDGSNNGTGSRDLTIQNPKATSQAAVIWVASLGGAGNGATNNTIKNLVITGGSSVIVGTQGVYGIVSSANNSMTLGNADNDNLTVTNNAVSKTMVGISAQGTVLAQDGLLINNNIIGSNTASEYVSAKGIELTFTNNATIQSNTIFNINIPSATGSVVSGIFLSTNVTGGIIDKNNIYKVYQPATFVAAYGIWISTGTVSGVTLSNNMISDIRTSNYSATTISNAAGITMAGGNNVKIYHNTINMSGTITGGTAGAVGMSSNVMITSTAVTNLDFRNNNLYNAQDFAGAGSAIYNVLVPAGFLFGNINYNNYFGASSATTNYRVGVSSTSALIPNYPTLTDWRGFTGQDVNSIAVQPPFLSPTDGHIDIALGAALDNKGTPIAGITTDIDGDSRSATTPDIGADEYAVVTGIDFGARALVTPAVKQCYSNAETVTIRIRNFSANTHVFASIPVTVNASVTGPNPQTFAPVIVNTGTLAPGDSMNVVVATGYDMSVLGTYTFNASTSVAADVTPGNNAMPVATRTLSATVAGSVTSSASSICISGTPTLTLSGSNAGTIQWQSAASATGPWTNVGTSSTVYTPGAAITASTYYRAYVVCNANSDTSNVQTVTVNNPQVLTTTPVTRCGPGTVNLLATGSAGASFNWYANATGGSPVFIGSSYTTPIISNTTTYYVTAAYNGGSSTVGLSPTATTCGTMSTTVAIDYPLRFDVINPVTINSAWVIPNAAGTFTVALRQALSATNIQTATFTFTAAQVGVPQQINLGWSISTPGSYQMTNTVGGVSRVAAFTCAYPYTSAFGGFSIVGSASISTTATLTTMYNSFFDINVSEGCESPRQAVTATVTTAPAFDVTNDLTVCNNAITTLQVNSTLGNFNTYVWTPVSGLYTNAAATTAYTAGTNASTVYERMTTPGTYTFIAQANNTTTGCQNFDSLKVTVLPASITVVPSPDQLCVSGISTLNISPSASTFGAAQYQWSSSPNNGTYTNIASATNPSYTTPTITSTTYYKMDLKNSAGVSCTTAYDTVIVNAPAILTTTPAALCGPGVMTLSATATAGSTINWYNTAGSLLGSGASFTTPNLTATTTYFAAALNGGGSADVGIKPTEFAVCGTPVTSSTTDYPIRFTTTKAVLINSAWVIPTSTSLTIVLRAQGSTTNLNTQSYTFTAAQVGTPQQITIGWMVSTPGNYQLTNTVGGMWRITTLGCGYPFATPSGGFTITGSAASSTAAAVLTYYNGFYKINVTEGCESPKIPVVAQVSNNTSITSQPQANISTCVGASINLVVVADGANLVYQWKKNGTNIPNSNNDTLTLNPVSLADAGTYTVTITGLCGSAQTSNTVTVNVSAANTWVGAVSSDWNTAANWCGGIPTSTTDVAIFSGTPYQPVINATLANVRTITINNGAILTLQPNGTLNLYGDFINNGTFIGPNGYVFFKGAANQNVAGMNVGNIMVNNAGGITLTGGMTVSGSTTLANGNITLGVNNLTINGDVTGTINNHIVTNSTGSVISKNITTSVVTIPVGSSATVYNPVFISNGGGRDYAVKVSTGLNPTIANPGLAVNRTWNITPSTAPASPVNISFQYEDTHMNTPGVATNPMEIGVHNGTSWAIAVASTTPSGTPTSRQVSGTFNQFGPMVVSNIGGLSWITATQPQVDPTIGSVKLLPNLVESQAVLRIVSTRTAKIRWTVMDAQGRIVMSIDRSVLTGQNDIPLQFAQLAGGMYTLSGTTEKGLTTTVKFVKQ